MKKKNINFTEEIKNSENFLHKLESIKKTSKDMKEKNKLTFHRNIWVKQYKYLSRLQRDFESQIEVFLESFDKFFQYEYQERQIFKETDYKTYNQMKSQLHNNSQLFSNKVYKQIEHLPLLVDKCEQIKKQEINFNDIQAFVDDIKVFLDTTESQINEEHDEINKHWNYQDIAAEQLDQGYEDIVYYFKPVANQVKGFDFQKERIKKVEEGEEHLLKYLQNFQDKLTGDQISEVIEQFNHANNLLHQTLELQIEKINLDYEETLSFSHEVIKKNSSYQRFLHLYQIYIGRGKSLIQYFQRLSIEFPKISKANIEHINDYIVAKIYKDRKIKSAKRNYLREKEELFYKVQKQVNLRIEKKIKDAQKQAETLLRREEKLKLEKELESLRAQYNKRQDQKKKQLMAIEQQKKVEQKKKQAIRRLYLDDLSKKAEEIKQIKEIKTKQISQQQKNKRMQQEIEKKKKLIENQPKVRQRQSIERKKIEKKRQVIQYKQKQQQIKEERINKAVEQYPFRPQVQFSEERLNALTEAQIIRKDVIYDKADKVELTKMTGYTVNQLMGDMRFRLNTALQQAGLANTDYAKHMLTQMSRKPT